MTKLPNGYEPSVRPVNIMTPADKRKARAMQKEYLKFPRHSKERNRLRMIREEFLKSKIIMRKANLTYAEAVKEYKPLKDSRALNRDNYVRKLGLDDIVL